MSEHPCIALIGAGPAGLTAANILQRHGRPFTVFEADASAHSRDQGGSLDLHPEDGQLALQRAGLLDEFLALARHEDQEQRVRDFASARLLREIIPEPGAGCCPEIDRQVLRELLLARLDPHAVQWGRRVEQVCARADGRFDLRCSDHDGLVGPFDLVVGADGAWSRARAALSDLQPIYTGITFIELWLNDVDRRHPALSALVGRGTLISLHQGAGLIAQRNGRASLRVYAAFRTRPEESERPDKTLAGMGKTELLARFPGWAPALLALITASDEVAGVRPICALPTPLGWPHRDGLTLIGDAAHLMPPLGVGVNLAMLDASDLAGALLDTHDWRSAVLRCETQMLERSRPLATQCLQAFDDWFGAAGTQALLENLDAHHA